jgi:8-oxo-dGTP pyrophosphatase MutT (NUDIX family)
MSAKHLGESYVMTESKTPIVFIEHDDFNFVPKPWRFADQRRADIEKHFSERVRRTPGIWNGRVLLANDCSVQFKTISGSFFETDYASYIAWDDWGCPDRAVSHCFSMGAIQAADGAFLLGVMGPHTARAGSIYFPAGIPDPSDIVGQKVDLSRSVVREVEEETGLTNAQLTIRPGWVAVLDRQRVALTRIMQASEPATTLRNRILEYLAKQRVPELTDIRIVRTKADYDPMMPPFVTRFLDQMLASGPAH